IFLASNDPSSGEKSSIITRFLIKIVNNITGYTIDASQEINITFIIRKTAHITEYGLLTMSYFYGLTKTILKEEKFSSSYIFSLILAVLYASSDEFHQTFIAGRVGTYKDVLIDSIGMIISYFILSKISKKNSKL
ncbi:MAG: VanZ family protein, partial [Candidatus Sericytochromatia bacterium]|nr:VanZ family protein [Candidatus Sericytochromatia bacterium]